MSSLCEEESETSSPELGFNEESFHSQYIVLRTIGQGSSAKVKLAHHRLTGMPVAVKVLVKKKQWCSPIVTEVDLLKFINHPNIISLLQVIQSEKRIYLIMELVEGQQLYRSIRESGCLSEDKARTIFQQIVSAVSYCHNNDIIHRDLKPDNIMVDSYGKVKIIDFGLGTKARPGQKLDQLCGAYAFGAPELHLGHMYDGPKVDMWTLGVLLYFIMTGTVPFDAITIQGLREQVIHGTYKIPRHFSDNLKRLLRSLLSVKPKYRPTVEEVLKHPWLLSQDKDLSMHDNEIIPTSPDPAIVAAMSYIGFDARDIKDSLLNRKCNATMASYCLFHRQARMDDHVAQKNPICQGIAPPVPSPADPVSFPLPLKRRESVPAYLSLLNPSCRDQLSTQKRIGRGKSKDVRLSAVSPYCLPGTPPTERASQSAPCSILRLSDRKSKDTMNSQDPSFKEPSPRQSEPGELTAFPQSKRRGWKKCFGRIGNYLMNLCCCLPSKKKSKRFRSPKVSPK